MYRLSALATLHRVTDRRADKHEIRHKCSQPWKQTLLTFDRSRSEFKVKISTTSQQY